MRVNEVENDFICEERSGKWNLSKSQDCETAGDGDFDIL